MIKIDHLGTIDAAERVLLDELLPSDVERTVNDTLTLPPRVYRPCGFADLLFPIAWLVVTVLGSSAALILSEFLKSIASELGKKTVEHYSKRRRAQIEQRQPLAPLVIVYEPPFATGRVVIFVYPSTLASEANIGDLLSTMEGLPIDWERETILWWDSERKNWSTSDVIFRTAPLPILWRGVPNIYPGDSDDL